MNATLTSDTRHEPSVHPGQQHTPAHHRHPQPQRRVGLVDRAALHLGVALIKWGRRPVVASEYERRANRLERALARTRIDAHAMAHRDGVRLDYAVMARIR